jgi:hypothetical protein
MDYLDGMDEQDGLESVKSMASMVKVKDKGLALGQNSAPFHRSRNF